MARRGLMQATGPEPFMGAAQQPDYQMMAQTDPAQYYQQTPLMRAVWEGRLPISKFNTLSPTWVGQAFEQDIKPAYDAWDAPDPMTVQGALDYAAMPAKAVTGMGKALYGHIKEGVTNPTMKNAGLLALDVAGLGGGLSRLGGGLSRLGGVPDGALGANVWQGGPHRYGPEGAAQSLQHMGKGEGAQAYGWGRYDAGNKAVAEDYKRTLSGDWSDKGRVANALYDALEPMSDGNVLFKGSMYNKSEFLEKMTDNVDEMWGDLPAGLRTATERRLAGYIYKHDLPDEDIARYLDWDKPLSAQPESVRAALREAMPDYERLTEAWGRPPTGRDAYGELTNMVRGDAIDSGRTAGTTMPRSQQAASEALGRAGVPGLKYLDQQSRVLDGGADAIGTATRLLDAVGGDVQAAITEARNRMARGNMPPGESNLAKAIEILEKQGDARTSNYVTWDKDVLNRMKLLERNGESMTGLMQPDRRG